MSDDDTQPVEKPEPKREANPTTHPQPSTPVPPPTPRRRNGAKGMATSMWMATNQVAEESGRHRDSVLDALNRQLLIGTQSHPLARWRIRRSDFTKWMDAGAPIDTPRQARIRRSA